MARILMYNVLENGSQGMILKNTRQKREKHSTPPDMAWHDPTNHSAARNLLYNSRELSCSAQRTALAPPAISAHLLNNLNHSSDSPPNFRKKRFLRPNSSTLANLSSTLVNTRATTPVP